MAWWSKKPSAAEQLRAQIEIEEMRARHATLKAANDRRDAAAAAVAKAEREREEKEWRKRWFKPHPRDAAFPVRREDPFELKTVKWLVNTALEDGRLREQDRARERHERRQRKRGGQRRERDDDDLELGRGR
jgi:hypothetical protein